MSPIQAIIALIKGLFNGLFTAILSGFWGSDNHEETQGDHNSKYFQNM